MINIDDQAQAAAANLVGKTLHLYPMRKSSLANANQFRRYFLAAILGEDATVPWAWTSNDWVRSMEARLEAVGYTIVEVDTWDYDRPKGGWYRAETLRQIDECLHYGDKRGAADLFNTVEI